MHLENDGPVDERDLSKLMEIGDRASRRPYPRQIQATHRWYNQSS